VPDEPSWPTVDDDVDEVVDQEPSTVQVTRPRTPQPPPVRARPADPPTMRIPITRLGPEPVAVERVPEPEDHADLQRVEPDEPGRRRRKPLLLVGSLIAVVALAAAAIFAAGTHGWFTTTPTAITQAPPEPASVTPVVRAVGEDAPVPSAQGVKAALAGPAANGLLGTLTGAVVDPATGTVLWQQADTTPLTPASTLKILTSAAALLALEHTDQLSTKVVAGPQPGTVVLVGGGDPTLSSLPAGTNTVYPGAATLDDLVAQVKANSGGTPVTQVIFDVSRYSGDVMAPGWEPSDVQLGSIAPIVPVMMDGGRQKQTDPDSPRTGSPAQAVAGEFARRLGVSAVSQGSAPANGKVLGEVKSAPVEQLVDNLLQISDNVLAEAMARQIAEVSGGEASFAGGVKAVRDVLTKNGFDLTGAELADGSGLSTADKIPARLLAQILSVAAKPDSSDPRTAKLRPLLTGIPVAGGSGTLAARYGNGPSAAGKGWVRAKTGTLTNVNSLAGVVVDRAGRVLVFAFMSNSPQNMDAVREALDTLATTLRGCGCS
jgi:D-alanyl-D-alanine carboxypeptidase/D-alanyl-D-alanine-endopeptidase (penicillin-binding protein 4)